MTEFEPGDRVRWVYNDMREGVVVGADDPETGTVRVCWGTGTYAHVRSHLAGELLELISCPEPTDSVRKMAESLADGMAHAGERLNEFFGSITRPEPTEEGCGECDDCASGCVCGSRECETPEPDNTPATDPIGTVRVHPDDDPEDPNARRAVKGETTWRPLTSLITSLISEEVVTDWPRQSLTDVARVLGHGVDAVTKLNQVTSGLAPVEAVYWDLADARSRAERLERELEAVTVDRDSAAEAARERKARAEKSERDHRLTRNALDSAYSEIRGLKDQVRGMAIDAMTVDNQAMENYERAILAEKRAASHWEAAKQYCRAMNQWVDISMVDAQKIQDLKDELDWEISYHADTERKLNELYELKKALRTLGS